MSILEGFPTPVRSFQEPEYRDPSSEIGALAARIDARFDEIEKRLDVAERLASERHQWALEAIARLADLCDLRDRVMRLESVGLGARQAAV